jgi:hypothetical protein
VDAAAQDRLRRKVPMKVVIYTDSFTPTELRDLFSKLAADDAKATPHVFDSLHATPVTTADQSECRKFFGATFDLATGKRSQSAPVPTNVPDGRPISAGTADQLAKTLNKSADKSAVVNIDPPFTPPTNSKELKLYSERRGERRPNTVPVMIVIRQANG